MITWRHRWGCLGLWIAAALCFLCLSAPGRALEFTPRSESQSGQFMVYCADVRLRLAVTGYVETAKHDVLEALDLRDHWKLPIVVNLRRPATTDSGNLLRQVRLIQTDGGWKVEIDVVLREGEFKQVRFPQLIIRAVLLELAYRDRPPAVGSTYTQPPAWLVEGLAQTMQVRATGTEPNAAIFRQLIETGRLPKIQDFLKSNVDVMDQTSLAIHGSCAASLVEMLMGTPGGAANLARMVKGLSESDGDPVALLLKYFPSLGGSEVALEKWWTLGLARYSSLDRHLSLTLPETDARLAPLLNLTVTTDEKKRTTQEFALTDYKTFLKLPAAKAALFAQSNALASLQAHAHPLLRPVVTEYQRIVNDLSRGKTRGTEEALASIGNYRKLIVERMDKIEDYLNWYEATQVSEQSGAFEDFLHGAKEMENWTPPKRSDAMSKYVDQLQREFE